MLLTLFIISTFVLLIVQIGIFKSLGYLSVILSAIPIIAVILNFFCSMLILTFTGAAAYVGLSNLAASILFGIYIILFKKYHQISIRIEKKGFIPYPKLIIGVSNLSGIKKFLF